MTAEDIRYWTTQTAHVSRGRDDAIAQAVKTCIGFGFLRINKPPEGHWLMEMWEFGSRMRSEAALDAMARDAEEMGL